MRRQMETCCLAITLAASFGGALHAELIGIGAIIGASYAPPPQGIAGNIYLYALTDSPNDNVISVSNATIFLSGVVPPPGFYNASPNPGVDPVAGAAPLTGIDWFSQPQMVSDSYVTIGNTQTDRTNTTVLEPSFDEFSFLTGGSIGKGTGWYNSDPSNGQGLPDPFEPTFGTGYILLGVFSIFYPDEVNPKPPPNLNVTSMSITYATGPFGTDLRTWELTTPLSVGYLPPAPGSVLPLALLGFIARRQRR